MVIRLFTYFRSGSSHRVRIALALKRVPYESVSVNLLRGGGEHLTPAFRAVNPQARLPVLEIEEGTVHLIQSPAILEYLDETVPEPPLLPRDPVRRARVRSVAALVGCDIHPLNNAAVLRALRGLGADEAAVAIWIATWITEGFAAIETMIDAEGWCFGDQPGLADIYLVPQLFSAARFAVPLDDFPRIRRVGEMASTHPAFIAAAPQNQPDVS